MPERVSPDCLDENHDACADEFQPPNGRTIVCECWCHVQADAGADW